MSAKKRRKRGGRSSKGSVEELFTTSDVRTRQTSSDTGPSDRRGRSTGGEAKKKKSDVARDGGVVVNEESTIACDLNRQTGTYQCRHVQRVYQQTIIILLSVRNGLVHGFAIGHAIVM